MISEKEASDKLTQIIKLGQEIIDIKNQRNNLCLEVQEFNKQKVVSRWPEISKGDKVRLTYSSNWDGKERSKDGFFGGAVVNSWDTYTTSINDIKIRLNQIKKDGTASMRYDDFYQDNIVSIVKID